MHRALLIGLGLAFALGVALESAPSARGTEPFVVMQVGAKAYPLYWVTSTTELHRGDGTSQIAIGCGGVAPGNGLPRLRVGQVVTLRLSRLVDKLTISAGRESLELAPGRHEIRWRVSASGRYLLSVTGESTDYGENGASYYMSTTYVRPITVTRSR